MKYCPKCRTEYEDWVKLCADCETTLVNQLPKEAANNRQDQSFVTVYRDVFMPNVDVIKSALESESILCNIKGYDINRPGLSFGVGIELQVPEKDRARAEEIIKKRKVK
jgi:hypothetical protein